MSTREQRIEAGVSFLDGVHGRDWPAKINLTELNMESPFSCMIGELDGNFHNRFKIEDEAQAKEAEDLGFFIGGPDFDVFAENDWERYDKAEAKVHRSYEYLTQAWKTRVRKLRKEREL